MDSVVKKNSWRRAYFWRKPGKAAFIVRFTLIHRSEIQRDEGGENSSHGAHYSLDRVEWALVDDRTVSPQIVKSVLQDKIVFHFRQIVSRQIPENLRVNVNRRSILFDNGVTAIQLNTGYFIFSGTEVRDVDLR